MDDNLYPISSEYAPRVPDQQVEFEQLERAKVDHDYKLMQEFIDFLESNIATLDSKAAIPEEIRLDDRKLAIKVHGDAVAVVTLTYVKEWAEDLIAKHIK